MCVCVCVGGGGGGGEQSILISIIAVGDIFIIDFEYSNKKIERSVPGHQKAKIITSSSFRM